MTKQRPRQDTGGQPVRKVCYSGGGSRSSQQDSHTYTHTYTHGRAEVCVCVCVEADKPEKSCCHLAAIRELPFMPKSKCWCCGFETRLHKITVGPPATAEVRDDFLSDILDPIKKKKKPTKLGKMYLFLLRGSGSILMGNDVMCLIQRDFFLSLFFFYEMSTEGHFSADWDLPCAKPQTLNRRKQAKHGAGKQVLISSGLNSRPTPQNNICIHQNAFIPCPHSSVAQSAGLVTEKQKVTDKVCDAKS